MRDRHCTRLIGAERCPHQHIHQDAVGVKVSDTTEPANEEITQLRSLIRRIEHELLDLTPEDRKIIQDAVNVVRAARQTVNLGTPAMPAT